MTAQIRLLGASDIRALAAGAGLRPTKTLGQNFVTDPGTVRRIAQLAEVAPGEHVVEVGPGLGSLTLALLECGARVTAVEIDPVLAGMLVHTVEQRVPDAAARLALVQQDALRVTPGELGKEGWPAPTALVANLPYNVAVPVILTLLERCPSLRRVLVMVQLEVAQRLAAPPGSRAYGIPSAKAAWYGQARLAGMVSRQVFWPVPNVESALVLLTRDAQPAGDPGERECVFAVIDAAFSARRKTLRAALAPWAGSPARAEALVRDAGLDPSARAEVLSITDFAALARAAGRG